MRLGRCGEDSNYCVCRGWEVALCWVDCKMHHQGWLAGRWFGLKNPVCNIHDRVIDRRLNIMADERWAQSGE